MKLALLFFLALLPVWSGRAAPSAKTQTVSTDANPAVQLPQIDVTASQEKKTTPIFTTNPLFDHPFADLRSGPMIEAIFWRHKYLENHPAEQAVIVTTHRGSRILSATTVYTLEGKIYGSSNSLGEQFAITGVNPAEMATQAGLARITDFIVKLRATYLEMAQPPPDPGDREMMVVAPPLGAVLVAAEESGNYQLIGRMLNGDGASPALSAAVLLNLLHDYFPAPSHEILGWTFEALRNPERAGIVPVTLGAIRGPGATAAVPPFASFTRPRHPRRPQLNFTPGQPIVGPPAPVSDEFQPDQFIAFDWDGVQYYYHPDVGTWAEPLPINSLTGLPDLCLRNGALLECIYFCAVYGKEHPAGRPAVIPGEPIATAYEADGKLGLFIPTLGGFTLPPLYLKALDDPEYLRQIRDQVVAAKKIPGKSTGAIPEEMSGDDGDLQMRRAFLACQAAGIACQLHENGPPSLEFTWQGVSYAYGSDQKIRSSVATQAPKSPTALVGPAISLAETRSVPVAEPTIPDNTPDLPDFNVAETASSPPAKAPTPSDKMVVMPPFVVATTRIAKNPWRYASLPGLEVLTRASTLATEWDLDGIRHGLLIQNAIIPKEWQPELPVPCTVIIDDTNLATLRANQPHSQAIKFAAPTDPLAWGDLSGRVHDAVQPISTDGDTFAVNSNIYSVDTHGVTYDSINLDRLLHSTPPLPAWVTKGLLGRNGLFRDGFVITVPERTTFNGSPDNNVPVDEARGPGTLWISSPDTQQLLQQFKRNKLTRIPLLPLAELFAETPVPGPKRALWESEAGLFLRWGLMGPGHDESALSQAFLSFVQRARREPVTEKLFTDCFGFGYGVMEDKLKAFLKSTLGQPTHIRGLGMPYYFRPLKLRAATADETGRILGDWIRMQGETIGLQDPPASRAFLEAANQMMLRAYRDDNALPDPLPPGSVSASLMQDPKLLAVYGLYAHDAGDDAKAREFLEAAVKADVVRPRAYQVLAELRYAEAVAKPQGTRGMLSAPQAASIIEPLKKALRFPASLPCYMLMVDTWGRCDAKIGREDAEMLTAGAALFPRSISLAYKAALVCARAGGHLQAEQLVQQGLRFATDAADRSRLEKLRSALGKTNAPSP